MEARVGHKPAGFGFAFTALVTVFALSFIGFRPAFQFGLPVAIASVCLCLYGFWTTRNWARTLVIILSVMSFANLVFDVVLRHMLIHMVRDLVIVLLSIFLLYWLTRPAVKGYFETSSAKPPPTI
jgi:hypothetical protein